MIPIVVEPTNFSFNIKNYKYSTDEEEIRDFIKFTRMLKILFDELEKRKFKIAVTKELYNLYASCIPTKIYSNSQGIKKNAVDLYRMRFIKLIKIVHKYGDHNYNVDINRSEIQNINLLSTEIYSHWLDMCGLIISEDLLPDILKANNKDLSIFAKDYAYLVGNENEKIKIEIHNCFDSICNIKFLKAMRLRNIVNKSINNNDTISCKGTGDHSSMWKRSIRKLEDVPPFERKILTRLIETGLVKSIQFLAFENNFPSVESPTIIINSMEEMTSCDVLMCTLRGKGRKQHCQDIKIELLKGTAKFLIDFFENEITLHGLEAIIEPPAAITLE